MPNTFFSSKSEISPEHPPEQPEHLLQVVDSGGHPVGNGEVVGGDAPGLHPGEEPLDPELGQLVSLQQAEDVREPVGLLQVIEVGMQTPADGPVWV